MGGSTAKSTVYLYAELVLLVLARHLPDFCSKMTQFVPHGLEKGRALGGRDRLINVILARRTVSYIACRLQVGDRREGSACQTLARLLLETHYFLCHGS